MNLHIAKEANQRPLNYSALYLVNILKIEIKSLHFSLDILETGWRNSYMQENLIQLIN